MERFSKFKDPLTGINPFIAPKYKPLTFKIVIIAFIKLPIYILYLLGFPVITLLIKIKKESNVDPNGLIYCNSVTEFDKSIIKKVTGISCFGKFKNKTCVWFPELTRTNNCAILKHKDINGNDYSIGLKYNKECIYLYGSRLKWLINFLGSQNYVIVNILKNKSLEKATNLPLVNFTHEDKEKFMSLL